LLLSLRAGIMVLLPLWAKFSTPLARSGKTKHPQGDAFYETQNTSRERSSCCTGI
jgi:hypothetical protein